MMNIEATLPEGWEEVPLLPFCHLVAAQNLTQRATALAAIVEVDPETLAANARLYQQITADLPFLDGLPVAAEALEEIVFGGVLYHHVGNLQKMSVGQLEALNSFLAEHEKEPLLAGPSLLAVLYKPAGLTMATWDADAIQATATAFERLPVSLAWPALANFSKAIGPLASSFQQYSAARVATLQVLETLEKSLAEDGAGRGWWARKRRGVLQAWIASVRKTLSHSLSRSSTAAK